MKKFFVLIAVLTAMLLTFGMAHAVIIEGNGTSTANILGNGLKDVVRILGVADYAPGNDVVVPFICGADATNNLDTLWAIAETQNVGPFTSVPFNVFNTRSVFVYDSEIRLTGRDVESDSCKALVAKMSPAQRALVERTIGGVKYYAGYITYEQPTANRNNLIGWQYLVDLTKGFAAGFNSYTVQNNLAGNLCESTVTGVAVCSTAAWMYPRYYLMNDSTDSFNWWVILSGTNAAPGTSRVLTGIICDETERCISLNIPIPDELNIINVADHVPAGLFTTFPKAGFGLFAVDPYVTNNTILGWSYQRAASPSGAALSWSVIHPIHKEY